MPTPQIADDGTAVFPLFAPHLTLERVILRTLSTAAGVHIRLDSGAYVRLTHVTGLQTTSSTLPPVLTQLPEGCVLEIAHAQVHGERLLGGPEIRGGLRQFEVVFALFLAWFSGYRSEERERDEHSSNSLFAPKQKANAKHMLCDPSLSRQNHEDKTFCRHDARTLGRSDACSV